MKLSARPPRSASRLPESLHRGINSYALAASAAGVSLLALAQPCAARVIYTRTHKVIGWNGVCSLDLNHDGVADFLILEASSDYQPSNGLFAKEAVGNAVVGYPGFQTWSNFALALKKGARIGRVLGAKQRFVSHGYLGEEMVSRFTTDNGPGTNGLWANVRNRYLGLRFKIDGKTHYGWARLSVKLGQRPFITATLSGYAYETVPNRLIVAGQTGEDAAVDSVQHLDALTRQASQKATLAVLALGAAAGTSGVRK